MTISELISKTVKLFTPPPDLLISAWANQFRKLSAESSAEVGDFDIARTPYMREILDSWKDPDVEEIVFKKSAQIAYSENLNNIVAYCIDQSPAPMLMIQPTLEMAESYSKDRIAPMLRDTPCLAARFRAKAKDSGSTILHKAFAGGYLQLIGANSPSALASRPICYVLGDEPDRWGQCPEGDQWQLAMRRQMTFLNRKRIIGGTPTEKHASRIDRLYLQGDQRKYFVPCPRCSALITLDFENFEADPKSHLFAQYCCQLCGGWIEEQERFDMIRDSPAGGRAEWRPTRKNDEAPEGRPGMKTRSYFIWAAYSPFISWTEIFSEWAKAKGDPETERAVVNTLFGDTYSSEAKEVDHEELFKQREDYDRFKLPADVKCITFGCDTQDDRFELEVVAWGSDEESWSLEYAQILGDPNDTETKDELWRYISEFRAGTVDGRSLVIEAGFMDSGGHRTDAVYQFVKGKASKKIFASKGSSTPGQPTFIKFSQMKKHGVKLAFIGTDTAKSTIFSRLAGGENLRARMHFPTTYGLDFFKGLTSEERKIVWKNGQPQIRYEKKKMKSGGDKKSRNEPLDCRVYAMAALYSQPLLLHRVRQPAGKTFRNYQLRAAESVDETSSELPAEHGEISPALVSAVNGSEKKTPLRTNNATAIPSRRPRGGGMECKIVARFFELR